MQLDRLTIKSQEALAEAQRIAQGFSHQEVDGEHLILALLGQSESLIPDLLEKIGVPPSKLKPDLERELARRHKVQGISDTDLFLSSGLKKALDAAMSQAGKLKDDYVSTEHLLLGLLDEADSSLKKIFQAHGLKRDLVLRGLADLRGNQRVTDPTPEDKFQALDKYGRDLTALARQGKIDPVIGRDEEIRREMQVLTRRSKNNPVLIGEPGGGKDAIAEGLARRIVCGDVAGTRKHIEKDPALERRFQPVFVAEPGVEATIAILRGLKERYEVHHGVRIQDSALVAAATLSNRYITDRFLPDKAIDLVDEAASRLRMELDSMPVEIDVLERQIMQLEIEQNAMKREKDAASRERLKKLEKELANLKKKATGLKAQWQNEKAAINAVSIINGQIEEAKTQLEQAQRRGDLKSAAEIQYGRIPELQHKLSETEKKSHDAGGDG